MSIKKILIGPLAGIVASFSVYAGSTTHTDTAYTTADSVGNVLLANAFLRGLGSVDPSSTERGIESGIRTREMLDEHRDRLELDRNPPAVTGYPFGIEAGVLTGEIVLLRGTVPTTQEVKRYSPAPSRVGSEVKRLNTQWNQLNKLAQSAYRNRRGRVVAHYEAQKRELESQIRAAIGRQAITALTFGDPRRAAAILSSQMGWNISISPTEDRNFIIIIDGVPTRTMTSNELAQQVFTLSSSGW